jgi:photosystem II stability/assembly factor-like uncharacterized protein
MHERSRTFAFGLLLLLLSSVAQSQWTQTSGPRGWQIQDIVSFGSTLYAGTEWGGTVFVSTDGGISWHSASAGLPASWNGLMFLRTIGVTLFAGTTNDGVFRSVDGGSFWSSANSGLGATGGSWYWSYDIAPLGSRVFLASSDGVYESRDGGSHWLASTLEPPYTQGTSSGSRFAAVDTFLFFGGRHGVFRTSLNSTAWTPIDLGVPDTIVRSIAPVGNSLFVSARQKNSGPLQRVLRSTDLGTTWTYADDGLPDTLYGPVKAIESDLYQREWAHVYRSSNLGDSWSEIDTLGDIWTANGIRYAQKKRTSGDETLLQSTDHGATWSPLSEPPIGQCITALAANGNRIVAATWNDQWDYSTTDRGISWTRLGGERVNLNVRSFAFCGPYLLAGGETTDGGIDISTDFGSTWIRVTNGSDAQIEYLAVDSPYVFASGNGMWVSTDCGLTWATRNSGLRSPSPYLGAMALLNGKLFVAEYGGSWGDSVFVSSDRGSSWKPAGRLGRSLYVPVSSLLTEGGALFAGTGDGLARGNGIWKSTDEGKTWTQTVTGLGDSVVNDIAASRGTIFAGTQDKGVFASTDAGESWRPVNEGLGCPHINRLLVHGQDLYAGTINEGVWRRPLSEVTGVEAKRLSAPPAFLLEQNYPNPFNPSTTIKYELPHASRVILRIYNTLGQEVATLVDETKAAGVYTVQFDAGDLASGVYFYRIEAGSFAGVKKLVLLR